MSVVICPKCGTRIPDEVRFCPFCGVTHKMQSGSFDEKYYNRLKEADKVCRNIQAMQLGKEPLKKEKEKAIKKTSKYLIPAAAAGFITLMLCLGTYASVFAYEPYRWDNMEAWPVYIAAILVMGMVTMLLIWGYAADEKKKRANAGVFDVKMEQIDRDIREYMRKNSDVLSILPPDYRYAEASTYFLTLFQNGRARSMREAVTIYEHWKYMQRIEQMQAAMQATLTYDQSAYNNYQPEIDAALFYAAFVD